MGRVYIKGATRMYNDSMLDAWVEAEENLGLENSIFFWDKGTTLQWVDSEEGEEFFNKVKKMDINRVFDEYFAALNNKDKVKIFECLAIFNEIDEHPEIANDDILRRLSRIRESTHNDIYKLSEKEV